MLGMDSGRGETREEKRIVEGDKKKGEVLNEECHE